MQYVNKKKCFSINLTSTLVCHATALYDANSASRVAEISPTFELLSRVEVHVHFPSRLQIIPIIPTLHECSKPSSQEVTLTEPF